MILIVVEFCISRNVRDYLKSILLQKWERHCVWLFQTSQYGGKVWWKSTRCSLEMVWNDVCYEFFKIAEHLIWEHYLDESMGELLLRWTVCLYVSILRENCRNFDAHSQSQNYSCKKGWEYHSSEDACKRLLTAVCV